MITIESRGLQGRELSGAYQCCPLVASDRNMDVRELGGMYGKQACINAIAWSVYQEINTRFLGSKGNMSEFANKPLRNMPCLESAKPIYNQSSKGCGTGIQFKVVLSLDSGFTSPSMSRQIHGFQLLILLRYLGKHLGESKIRLLLKRTIALSNGQVQTLYQMLRSY